MRSCSAARKSKWWSAPRVSVGFRKFRLTGGEPTLRADMVEIVGARGAGRRRSRPRDDHQCADAPELAQPLKEAGLGRINVHLDSLNPETVERQMRWGNFDRVWAVSWPPRPPV